MMKPIRPSITKGASFPPEFREEVVRYWLSSGQTLATVAADLGLSPPCLRAWHQQIEAASAQPRAAGSATNTSQELALARENGQLRHELEAMTRQRDILKKAISIFSEDKSVSRGLK